MSSEISESAQIHAKVRELYPPVTEAHVRSLADPLVRHMSEPPHDVTTVLAVAVRGALYEAWELIEHGETLARITQDPTGMTAMLAEGQIYAGKKIIHQVADALRLLRPGENATPAERLLAARSRARLTQPDLAAAAHITRSHLSRIERGERTLTPVVARAIAPVLGVTPEYLLTGKDPDGS